MSPAPRWSRIIAIVLTAIIAGVVSVFIARPGFAQSAQRAELLDMADLTLRRISRDVHTALPTVSAVVRPAACAGTVNSGKITTSSNSFLQPGVELSR